jgi:murein DD-endopeptidase MepM/ murein hydrolase activator NlpD
MLGNLLLWLTQFQRLHSTIVASRTSPCRRYAIGERPEILDHRHFDPPVDHGPIKVDTKCSCRHCAARQGGNYALVAHSVRLMSRLGSRLAVVKFEGSAGQLQNQDKKRGVASREIVRSTRRIPTPMHPRPIALETSFLEEPPHHRWLLTTCIAGVACSLLVGGMILGLFGQNAVPPEALASVQPGLTQEIQPQASAVSAGSKLGETQVTSSEVLPERDLSGEWKYPEITQDDLPYDSQDTAVLDAEIEAVESESENITTISKTPPPEPVDETFRLAKGSTLARELTGLGISKAAAQSLIASIEPILPQSMIKDGTQFEVTLDRQIDFYGREVTFPVQLSFKPGPKETIVVEADEDGRFDARIDGAEDGAKSRYAQYDHFRTKSQIGSSLYATAKDNRVPDYIVSEFTRVFSYDVDFQRQISASDSFEVFYGAPLTGSSSKRKVMHFAQLNFDGKTKTYYRFTSEDGQTDYYDDYGRSASRSLLKTPISGARLTSGFGMRRHPLLGYSKMHAGVDFGAPSGTPIRAAGSGTVDLAGRNGAYGIAVMVKHNAKYKTLYAHMSKLAAGVRKGTRVNQGQIIGYVGSTGRSTGPHLHYEVRVNNRPVNPTAIKAAGGKQLAGGDMRKFKVMKQRVHAMMKQAPSAVQVAQAGQ